MYRSGTSRTVVLLNEWTLHRMGILCVGIYWVPAGGLDTVDDKVWKKDGGCGTSGFRRLEEALDTVSEAGIVGSAEVRQTFAAYQKRIINTIWLMLWIRDRVVRLKLNANSRDSNFVLSLFLDSDEISVLLYYYFFIKVGTKRIWQDFLLQKKIPSKNCDMYELYFKILRVKF